MPETNTLAIQCPKCGHAYQAPVRSVIDVGQNPQLRQAFLSGQLNLAVCPKCRTALALEVPLVYHDPAAEFLAIYFPPQLNVPEMEKQKLIGELTQSLMRSLPPEQRKGYFLSPRQFINRQSLMDAILGTMGISQETLDRQRKKVKFIEQLMVMADDPKGLQMMIKGQDAQFDSEFFALLSNSLERALQAGDQRAAQQLANLRERLLESTTFGQRMAKQEAAIASLKDIKSAEEFLERVIAADPDEAGAIALAARPMMDYAFFQALTERIEAASGAERERLSRLRDQLVEITTQLDEAAKAAMEDAAGLLQELLAAPDVAQAVRDHADELDDTFLAVLSANMQQAQRRGARAAFQRMAAIYEEIVKLMQESMPPEVQLVNALLAADYPEGTRALLKEQQAQITPEFMDLLSRLAEEIGARGDPESVETAKRLRDIHTQATLLI